MYYLFNFFSDTAVLSGSLTWARREDENRTTAQLLLSLSLLYSQFPMAREGDRVKVAGATLDFGDGVVLEDMMLPLEVQLCTCMYMYYKIM